MISPSAATDSAIERRRLHVEGIVQGVGFRPFVFNLAQQLGIGGWVLNNSNGVEIEVEGDARALDDFTRALQADAPALASIVHVAGERITPLGEHTFRIEHSQSETEKHAWIAPDASICDDCLRELFDPDNRRFHYPFINCTNCGPRFTIIKDVPYDRPQTTMAAFTMCDKCQREYDDPHDRRFHAQPNACARCGPVAMLRFEQRVELDQDALEIAARLLDNGNILAVKGLGGYHLACDATNEHAVAQLRARKHRYDKPFALMVGDVATARTLCEVSDAEEKLLSSRRRPIVLLRARAPLGVAESVAPQQKYLGVMLPYTPLHYLLMDRFSALSTSSRAGANAPTPQSGEARDMHSALVMTSGNLSDEPIAYTDDDARARLGAIADQFLTHDRAIHMRADDSVARVVTPSPVSRGRDGVGVMMIRRSRGYAPEPLRAPHDFAQPVLAVGAHLKNTFCLGKGHYAFVSHHIGDLENYETLQSFGEGIAHFKRLFDIEPRVIAHDLHPEYLSTKWAQEQVSSIKYQVSSGNGLSPIPCPLSLFPVQHHHAHIASVMGEHGLTQPVIGIAFDGTGYGTDGTIWGGEFLVADYAGFERVVHLDTIPLLGGEQAIHEVWRLAAAWLDQVYGDEWLNLDIEFVRRLDRAKWRVLKQMATQHINAPHSSAMGRLFDAVAALIGVRGEANYEAQAAIELEMCADESCMDFYPFRLDDAVLHMDDTMRAIVADLQNDIARSIIAARFHNTIADAIARACVGIRAARGLNQVVLGGGVFQNVLLLRRTLSALDAAQFEVFVPTRLPPNDGGLSFGQALIANSVLSACPVRRG